MFSRSGAHGSEMPLNKGVSRKSLAAAVFISTISGFNCVAFCAVSALIVDPEFVGGRVNMSC